MTTRAKLYATATLTAATIVLGYGAYLDNVKQAKMAANSASLNAVGGREIYIRERAAHLRKLRNNIHVTDPVVRAREVAEIDRQLNEIGAEVIQERGDEMTIERVGK
jgi:hypothetical protein